MSLTLATKEFMEKIVVKVRVDWHNILRLAVGHLIMENTEIYIDKDLLNKGNK